ncbi:hypothetical protein ACHJH3_06865 [Campylobacter sp. MOP7]|uniref:hypothetical protein n=1 Tax=Campylobacter canis TaxID=3378588 RepID=UPI00387E95C2
MFLDNYENSILGMYVVFGAIFLLLVFMLMDILYELKMIKFSIGGYFAKVLFGLTALSLIVSGYFNIFDRRTNIDMLNQIKSIILQNLNDKEKNSFLSDSNMVEFGELRPLRGFLKCGNEDTKQECLAFIEKTIIFYKNEKTYKQNLSLDFQEYQNNKNKE